MTVNMQRFDIMSIGSLDAYLQMVNRLPMLSQEEEQNLATRWHTQQDLAAARALVLAHLRFVARVAKGYLGYGLPLADLIQEGNIGLMKAVKRFNPEIGVRLVSFAVHWVKAEIQEFIIKNWRIVKIATTKAQRKLFFNLRSAKERLGWFNQDEVKAVAEDLGVTPADVMEMENRLQAMDSSFDTLPSDDDEQTHFAPALYLEDQRYDPAQQFEAHDQSEQEHQQLEQAMSQLDDRSQDILKQRWLNAEKATLHDLAAQYQISAERVRQLEKAAMSKLKQLIALPAA